MILWLFITSWDICSQQFPTVPPGYTFPRMVLVPASNIHPLIMWAGALQMLYKCFTSSVLPDDFNFQKICTLLTMLCEKLHSEQLWWGSQLAVISQLFPAMRGNCHQSCYEIFLIFHMTILPPILKTGVCLFLISSNPGVLFSLKYLVKGHCFLNTRTSVLFYSFIFCVSLAASDSASRPQHTVSCFLTSLSHFLQRGVHDI